MPHAVTSARRVATVDEQQTLTWDALPSALGLAGSEVVSFVGGGGKTTSVFALAAHRPGRCIVTTTTKMGVDRTGGLPVLLAPSDDEIVAALDRNDAVLAWSGADDRRGLGVEPARCDHWATLAETVAVEADGSRRRPFKAPRAYEPVVPASTTVLVACVGMAAVNAPIEVGCYRTDAVAALVGASAKELLTPERLVRVLLHRNGSRKGQPDQARFAVLINRVTSTDFAAVDEIRRRVRAHDPEISVLAMADVEAGPLPGVR